MALTNQGEVYWSFRYSYREVTLLNKFRAVVHGDGSALLGRLLLESA